MNVTDRGANPPVVYVDGTRRGGPEELRVLRADQIAEMRFMSALDATTRYGLNHDGGAILVSTLGRRPTSESAPAD